MTNDIQVLVVGGGIGGVVLAGFLRQRGIEPVVIEKDEAWNDSGYGLLIRPNGMVMLEELDVADAVRSVGHRIDAWTMRDTDGTVREQAALDVPNEHAFTAIHRTQLHQQLRRIVPESSVRMGTSLRSLTQSERAVTVEFSDGVRERFDVVVGADGTRSQVRTMIDAGEGEFCNTHTWAFRVDTDRETPHEPTEIWGEHTAFLFLPTDGRDLAWVVSTADEAGQYDDVSVDALRETSAEIGWLVPDIVESVDSGDVWHDDNYRVTTDRWADSRVALLGDAAHALHPAASIGATLAMEDAYVLADELATRHDALEVRLADYVGRRRSRVRKFQQNARLSPQFSFAESAFVGTIHDALAVRAHLLEKIFFR